MSEVQSVRCRVSEEVYPEEVYPEGATHDELSTHCVSCDRERVGMASSEKAHLTCCSEECSGTSQRG